MEDRKIDLELTSEPQHRQADRDALTIAKRAPKDKDKGRGKSRSKPGAGAKTTDKPARPRKPKQEAPPASSGGGMSAREKLVAEAAKLALDGKGKNDKSKSTGSDRKRKPGK
jgi:ribonuclease R